MNDDDKDIMLRGAKEVPPLYAANLLAAGYGTWDLTPSANEDGPSIGHFMLTFKEMDAMGEAERIRLGVQSLYEFILSQDRGSPTEMQP